MIIKALEAAHPELVVEQLRVSHPGADDDGLWFFRHPASPFDVQLESSSGACPFLFATTARSSDANARTVSEAISFVTGALGLGASQD